MSETTTQHGDKRGHRLTALIYLLDLLGVATFAVTAVVGVSLNYARRERVRDTIYASHFAWQIRSFWWAFGAAAVGGVLILVAEAGVMPQLGAPGALVILIALFWFVYRILKGYMWLTAGEPVRGRREQG